MRSRKWLAILLCQILIAAAAGPLLAGAANPKVIVLLYHRLGPVRSDSMTVTIEHFKEQVKALQDEGFHFITLQQVVDWRLGKGAPPPDKSVALTFDDGHISVFRDAQSILVANHIPVTLFIYPSCISHASYAMSWEQVSSLTANPLFTVESHTLWHPNFKRGAKKQTKAAYAAFVDNQLRKSKAILEEREKHPIRVLAWPFGIYDPYLIERASAAGYSTAFTIQCHAVGMSDPAMALPRCIVADENVGKRFDRFLDALIMTKRE